MKEALGVVHWELGSGNWEYGTEKTEMEMFSWNIAMGSASMIAFNTNYRTVS